MKQLLGILAASAVFFIAIAMMQEWQVFATAWFGYQPEVPTLSEADRKDAENALSLYLSLTSHLFRSNGDQRFLERIPAAPRVTDELMAEVLYLQHNGRFRNKNSNGWKSRMWPYWHPMRWRYRRANSGSSEHEVSTTTRRPIQSSPESVGPATE